MSLCITYCWNYATNETSARELARKSALKPPLKRVSKISEETWGPKQHPKLRRGERASKA